MLQHIEKVLAGGAGLIDDVPTAIRELQSQGQVVVDGAAAATEIAVPGLLAKGTVRSVIMYAAGVPSNVTAKAGNADGFISSTGKIKLTEDSTGNKLVVTFVNKT